ncbi:MAG: hypothetical protein P8010_26930 [Desulfosarcinaceae bacterium]
MDRSKRRLKPTWRYVRDCAANVCRICSISAGGGGDDDTVEAVVGQQVGVGVGDEGGAHFGGHPRKLFRHHAAGRGDFGGRDVVVDVAGMLVAHATETDDAQADPFHRYFSLSSGSQCPSQEIW